MADPPAFGEQSDWVELYGGETQTWYVTGADANVLSLYQQWSRVEFNVFGDMNGDVADFDAGTQLTVEMAITPATAPGGAWLWCSEEYGLTGERNNLNLQLCTVNSSGNPGIVDFVESN